MFKKLASAVSSVVGSAAPSAAPSVTNSAVPSARSTPGPPQPKHEEPERAAQYAKLVTALEKDDVPVSHADCASCSAPCAEDTNGGPTVAEIGNAWDGKTYSEYVEDKYGDLGHLPKGFDTDWESDLAGSGGPPVGRVVVVSTAKSNWVRDHTDEKSSLSYQINQYMESLNLPGGKKSKGGDPLDPSWYVLPSQFPPPSTPLSHPVSQPPALYSSSLISQSDDPEDQMTLVFPDWKVCLEVENSSDGAKGLWNGALAGNLGRAGALLTNDGEGVSRRRSYVMPYRAIVLLCSHKTRDNKCGIAAPILRNALINVLEKNGVSVDETGGSLAALDGPALEMLEGGDAEREEEVGRRIEDIEGVHGGEGGEVGIFNINHLGGHRYAGVMLILFPSGAYLSYGRISPLDIPRVVEETILAGKIVPGLLRSAAGVARKNASAKDCGFLAW